MIENFFLTFLVHMNAEKCQNPSRFFFGNSGLAFPQGILLKKPQRLEGIRRFIGEY